MKHWNKYILKQKKEYLQNQLPTDFAADIIVVIPCLNEPNLNITLQSLCDCNRTDSNIVIITLLNSGVRSRENEIEQNRRSLLEINDFAKSHETSTLKFFQLIFENLPRKHAGVGLARKIGMDIAVKHFLDTQNANGIIVSLDADCTVSKNFFVEIEKAYKTEKKLNCTIHNFHHRVDSDFPQLEKPIRQYEKYIRYFSRYMQDIGFPYFYHTIGSAFSVLADAYIRVGGMGRQQGGEDFYFLQKIFTLGYIKELQEVFVYPMARFSDRVPFGTGPSLQKIIDDPDKQMSVYSRQSFQALGRFFAMKDNFFKQGRSVINYKITQLHPSVIQFIEETDFIDNIEDCNKNAATLETFRKRFFHHFNAFKIIKFLNFAHIEHFAMENITDIT